MKPPPRLLDDALVAPELRRDLNRTASAPSAYDTVAGFAGLQAAIAGSMLPPAVGTEAASAIKTASAGSKGAAAAQTTAGLLGSVSAKVVATVVGTAAVVAISVASWPARPSTTVPAEARDLTLVAPLPAVPGPEPLAEPPARAAEPPTALATEPAATPRAPASQPNALRREIAQLGRIKAVLDRNPAQAYRLAQAGHREFSRGTLRQEREALAVLALASLHRRAEAESRARAFIARYPESPLRERLERMLHGEVE